MKRITAFLAALFLAAGVLSARESLKVASIFSDHMVLQRETQAPVWGWAQPGAKVTVSPSWDEKSKYTAKVEKDGSYVFHEGPVGSYTLSVAGMKTFRSAPARV